MRILVMPLVLLNISMAHAESVANRIELDCAMDHGGALRLSVDLQNRHLITHPELEILEIEITETQIRHQSILENDITFSVVIDRFTLKVFAFFSHDPRSQGSGPKSSSGQCQTLRRRL
jgi:hypothetical protein